MSRSWFRLLGLLLCCASFIGCGNLLFPFNKLWENDDDDDETVAATEQVPSATPTIEPTDIYAIALGGVAPGRDELIVTDSAGTALNLGGRLLNFTVDNPIIGLLPRPGFTSFGEGSGAQIVPQTVGVTKIHYQIDGVEQPDIFQVTIPPQELIQILMGEARSLLKSEATITDGVVQLASRSATGDTIAAVIRNRLALIDAEKHPGLFVANSTMYYSAPPASSYVAVIEAASGGFHQFSPVDPDDASHAVYTQTTARSFLDPKEQFAYDQAVFTAAAIFDGRTDDATGGAFAFRSPSVEEAACLTTALQNKPATLPAECGPGDENYPALAPVQILIHPEVGKQSDGRPAFIFYRQRPTGAPSITDQP